MDDVVQLAQAGKRLGQISAGDLLVAGVETLEDRLVDQPPDVVVGPLVEGVEIFGVSQTATTRRLIDSADGRAHSRVDARHCWLAAHARVLPVQAWFRLSGVVDSELSADGTIPAYATAIRRLDDGLILALYPRTALAKDANIPVGAPQGGEFGIGRLVESKDGGD